jgi:hypothetical protein
MSEGVFAILGSDHVCMFKDGSMLLDAKQDEIGAWVVMKRHGYKYYEFPTAGAAKTFCSVNHCPSSGLFVRENGKSYHVVMFTGWESENGNQMREHPRFIEVQDMTAAVLAANEAEEISEDDLEAAAAFMNKLSHTLEQE